MRTIIKSKKLSVLEGFLILAISFAAYAQDNWIPFGAEGIPQKADLQVVRCDAQGIRIDARVPGMLSRKLGTKGVEFTRLILTDYGYTTEIGKPQLPVIRELVEIPYGASFSVEVIRASTKEVNLAEIGIDTKIIPVQPPVPKIPNANVTFEMDRDFYQKDSYYLTDIVKIHEIGIMRGHRLVQIEIFPVNYNSKTSKIKFYTDIQLKINLIGSDLYETRMKSQQYRSPAFEKLLKSTVINYGNYGNNGLNKSTTGSELSIGFLIYYSR